MHRKLANDLEGHAKTVRGAIVAQDMRLAAKLLRTDRDLIDRLQQIMLDTNLQRRQLNTTLDELASELKGQG